MAADQRPQLQPRGGVGMFVVDRVAIQRIILLWRQDQAVGIVDVPVQVPDERLIPIRAEERICEIRVLGIGHRASRGVGPLEYVVVVGRHDQLRPQRPQRHRQGQVNVGGLVDGKRLAHHVAEVGQAEFVERLVSRFVELTFLDIPPHDLGRILLRLPLQPIGQHPQQLAPRWKQTRPYRQTDARADERHNAALGQLLNQGTWNLHGPV